MADTLLAQFALPAAVRVVTHGAGSFQTLLVRMGALSCGKQGCTDLEERAFRSVDLKPRTSGDRVDQAQARRHT